VYENWPSFCFSKKCTKIDPVSTFLKNIHKKLKYAQKPPILTQENSEKKLKYQKVKKGKSKQFLKNSTSTFTENFNLIILFLQTEKTT
jgi:hypothetical protein